MGNNHIKKEWFKTPNAGKVALSIIDLMEPNPDGESPFDDVFQELGDRYNIFSYYTPKEALIELCAYELEYCGFDKRSVRNYCSKLDELSLSWIYLNDKELMPEIKMIVDNRENVTLDDVFLYISSNEIFELPPTMYYMILNRKKK